MRFVIDEMFPPRTARELTDLGHDARHVRDVGLAGAADDEVLRYAAREPGRGHRECVDFVPLLHAAVAVDDPPPAVVLARKRTLPTTAGAMAHALATRLARWADDQPDPCRNVHWLG